MALPVLGVSPLVLVCVAVGLLVAGFTLTVCIVWPVCWLHRNFIKNEEDYDDPADCDIGTDPHAIWERHPGFWLPSHDISAGDSSQPSDEEGEIHWSSGSHPGVKPATEKTSLRAHVGRHHYRSTHPRARMRDSSADSSSSECSGQGAPYTSAGSGSESSRSRCEGARPRPPRTSHISAMESHITWDSETCIMGVRLKRLVLRSFRRRKKYLCLRLTLQGVTPNPSPHSTLSTSGGSDDGDAETPAERDVYITSIGGLKEQTFTDVIQTDLPEGLKDNVLKFRVCDRRNVEESETFLEGSVLLEELNANTDNFMCVIMRPQITAPGSKGESVISLCYLPTAEKLSIAILECRNLATKPMEERYTAIYIKVALVHRGRSLKKKKTKSKPIKSNIMFNETYTFDVPRKHIQGVSIVLTFKQLLYDPDIPRMTEKTVGKCVLGAAAQTETAQQHWGSMILNARKPSIQCQGLW